MTQRRLEKMNELLKETVAVLLLQKSKDPRLRRVNVTAVKMTPDLKRAVVLYSLLGGEEEKAAAQKVLDRAAGFVRVALGEALKLKYTPEIKFEFDRNLEYAQHMTEILKDISRDQAGAEGHDR
jgi:ribosome-binding factor A